MEKFLSLSAAALLLLAGFVRAALTDEALTESFSSSTSTAIPNISTSTSTTTNNVTKGPATVRDPHTTSPTQPASTTVIGGGKEKDKGEKEKSREDDKLGRRAELRRWLNFVVCCELLQLMDGNISHNSLYFMAGAAVFIT